MSNEKRNMELMQTLDDAWDNQDWDTFDKRHKHDVVVRWPAQPATHLAGLASASKQVAQVLIDGYAFGSLSMTSYTLEAKCPTDGGDRRPGASLPDPRDVPADDTNV